jgi:hypothetical protein
MFTPVRGRGATVAVAVRAAVDVVAGGIDKPRSVVAMKTLAAGLSAVAAFITAGVAGDVAA